MKILFCEYCGDLFNLKYELKSCNCGKTKGKYCTNLLNAVITDGIVISFSEATFLPAIRGRPNSGLGKHFIASILPKYADTVEVISLEDIEKDNTDE